MSSYSKIPARTGPGPSDGWVLKEEYCDQTLRSNKAEVRNRELDDLIEQEPSRSSGHSPGLVRASNDLSEVPPESTSRWIPGAIVPNPAPRHGK